MQKKLSLLLVIVSLSMSSAMAQKDSLLVKNPCGSVEMAQPTLSIFPFTKEGESTRRKIENNPNLQTAMSVVADAFRKRDFFTRDFITLLKEAEKDDIFSSGTIVDERVLLMQYASTDIVVEVNLEKVPSSAGNNQVNIILNAIESSSGIVLASKTSSSNISESNNISMLAAGAVDKVVEEFLNSMQTSFDKLNREGKSIALQFRISENSSINISSRFGTPPKPLNLFMKDWVASHSVNHRYTAPVSTGNLLKFASVQIPLRNPSSCSEVYTLAEYAFEIESYLEKFGIGLDQAPVIEANKLIFIIK